MPLPHSWSVSPTEAAEIQRRMRGHLVMQAPPGFAPRLVAGADISLDVPSRFAPDRPVDNRAYAGIVVIDRETMETAEEATAVAEITFPYVPGLLSFRELPAVAQAWDALRTRPDVLIFDGAGYAHPRRFGLACHGGVLFDVPSIGCAKSILVGRHGPLGERRGSAAELVDRGEVVGMAVRLRDRVNPVYVSIGHKMDLPTAVEVVLSVAAGYREPETTRRAHRLVNEMRKGLRD
ncbi:MAG TPA: endonuclease V [Gemmatimonadaceae bacterium]|nr:endonuclease V [Gemmatimonadaceae bacterium]